MQAKSKKLFFVILSVVFALSVCLGGLFLVLNNSPKLKTVMATQVQTNTTSSVYDLIEPATFSCAAYSTGGTTSNYDVHDYVYLMSNNDANGGFQGLTSTANRRLTPSDYALANNSFVDASIHSPYDSVRGVGLWLTRSASGVWAIWSVYNGSITNGYGANGSGKTTIANIIQSPSDYKTCTIEWEDK